MGMCESMQLWVCVRAGESERVCVCKSAYVKEYVKVYDSMRGVRGSKGMSACVCVCTHKGVCKCVWGGMHKNVSVCESTYMGACVCLCACTGKGW